MALQQSELSPVAVTVPPEPAPPPGRGYREGRWRSVLPLALTGGWLAIVVLGAIFADVLPLKSPDRIAPANRLQGPSSEHWFGTDELGRDIFARAVYGSRVSLIVGLASVAIGLTLGGAFGIVAGYFRGKVDAVISWLMDVVLSFPGLVLLIALVAFTGGGLRNISLALGFLSVPIYARLARAHTLTLGGEEFVLAARASGATRSRILWREIAPNVLLPLSAYGLVAMSLAVVIEGSLSFLGLSVAVPTPSWGGLIAGGYNFLRDSTSGVLIPAAILCLTVLSLNVIGERFRRRYEVGAGG